MVFPGRPLRRTVHVVTIQKWVRIALGYLIVVTTQIALWALVAPRSFYDDFPGLGRAWVSVDGPYNEHLVRDVGALNLALAVVLIATFVRLGRDLTVIAGLASLAWGVPLTVYHLANTDGLSGSDIALSLGGLVLFAVIGGGLLWSGPRLDMPSRAVPHTEVGV